MKNTFLILISLVIISSGYSQNSIYESKEIKRTYEKGTRSRQGIPGENYWQNFTKYDLITELDPESRLLKGSGTITYSNNSPDTLKFMLIKLLPNIHKEGSARDYAVEAEHLSQGLVIDSIAISGIPQSIHNRRKFIEYGTNLYVIFEKSEHIAPGGKAEIFIAWNFEVTMHGIRNGAYNDSSYFIGYWYPQVAVYDDVYRWDREDYTGKQETYNDLGSYEVKITVPEDYIVWATGDQLNKEKVFSDHTLNLIHKSRESEETINIVTSDSYANDEVFKKDHSNTWIFKAVNIPDFAWACSNYYFWDANSLNLNNGVNKKIWINAVYPPNTKTFDKVADVAHQSIDYLSNVFPGIPYPFNKHITFNGIDHIAVEYPMMANNSDHSPEEMYTELTIHEIAHNYIPFYMLSNERKHAWIDEGWVKLIGELHGESLGIKREDKHSLNSLQIYERSAGTSNDLPLIVPSGSMTVRDNFFHSYAKASISNMFLLELMKEKGIDNPLKEFLTTWKGKHPTPYDFFYFMNELCGEDLSWFWNPWYFDFSYPDLGIEYAENSHEIMVVNHGGIPVPVNLTITYTDNRKKVIESSIWNWAGHTSQYAIKIPDIEHAKMISLGAPYIPDINKDNNILEFGKEDLGKL